MSKRLIQEARGFVHDIDEVLALSDSQTNIRLLCDRSLYILQNLSGKDVTFLSRYGVIETDGYYDPVKPGTASEETVYNAVNLIRRDLTDMSIETTLECICSALQDIAASVSAGQGESCTCTVGTDVETTDGQENGPLPDPVNGVAYEPPLGIVYRKCKAANYIHISIRDVVNELKLNRADQYGFAGVASVLFITSTIIGGIAAPPFGLLVGAVIGAFLAMATALFKGSFSLTILDTVIKADEPGAICSLYEAVSASGARDAYKAHLQSQGATSLELEFVEYLLSNNVLNLLFFAWGDSESAIDNTPVVHDCSACCEMILMQHGTDNGGGSFNSELLGDGVTHIISFWVYSSAIQGPTCGPLVDIDNIVLVGHTNYTHGSDPVDFRISSAVTGFGSGCVGMDVYCSDVFSSGPHLGCRVVNFRSNTAFSMSSDIVPQ